MRRGLICGIALLTACLLTAALVATPSAVDGCCMVPRDYPGDVDQSMQEVLILHADGHEELVIRVRPFFRDAEEAPASLAWLVTVPSKPTAYRTASMDVFPEARHLHQRLVQFYRAQEPREIEIGPQLKAMVTSEARGGHLGLDISEAVTVGPYTITEVRTRGSAAVGELNRYLDENGFGTEDPAHLRWFAENDFTFLCIRIEPPEGSVRLGKHLDLVPLQIGFASERPYYPGKYSANQGNFGLALTVLTSDPLLHGSLRRNHARLDSRGGHSNLFTVKSLPGLLGPVLEKGFPGGPPAPGRWYVNRVDSNGFNRMDLAGTPAIAKWPEDVFWDLGGPADLPPDWYYGDGERPLLHPNNLHKLWAVLLILAVAALGLWLLRRIRRRAAA